MSSSVICDHHVGQGGRGGRRGGAELKMYRASFIISYYDQQMHNYFTNYHTPTCFDTIVRTTR